MQACYVQACVQMPEWFHLGGFNVGRVVSPEWFQLAVINYSVLVLEVHLPAHACCKLRSALRLNALSGMPCIVLDGECLLPRYSALRSNVGVITVAFTVERVRQALEDVDDVRCHYCYQLLALGATQGVGRCLYRWFGVA
eukprot:TRINITY_DN11278_c1_g1_i1.p2 TRINITY_DN11278_c1_g1~~TRINITY_DN11278_c1_g1_i1.p2  ORF type:complete len:140 (+),score=11.36 TRINITY_DN11278_c1_g1_i1:442-861(+)